MTPGGVFILVGVLMHLTDVSCQTSTPVEPVSEVCRTQHCLPGWIHVPAYPNDSSSLGNCYLISPSMPTPMCNASKMCSSLHNASLLYFDSFAEWRAFEQSAQVRNTAKTVFSNKPRLWFSLVANTGCNRKIVPSCWIVANYSWHPTCSAKKIQLNWTKENLGKPWTEMHPDGDGRCHELVENGSTVDKEHFFFWNDIDCNNVKTDHKRGYVCKRAESTFGQCDCPKLKPFEKKICKVIVAEQSKTNNSTLTLVSPIELDTTNDPALSLEQILQMLNATVQNIANNRTAGSKLTLQKAVAKEVAVTAGFLLEHLYRDVQNVTMTGRVLELLQQFTRQRNAFGETIRLRNGRVQVDGFQGQFGVTVNTSACLRFRVNDTYCRYGYKLTSNSLLVPSLFGPYFVNSKLRAYHWQSNSDSSFRLEQHGTGHLCAQLVKPNMDVWSFENCSPSSREVLPLRSEVFCNCSGGAGSFRAVFSHPLNDVEIIAGLSRISADLAGVSSISANMIGNVIRRMDNLLKQRSANEQIGELLLSNVNTILENSTTDNLQLANEKQQTTSKLLRMLTNYFSQVLLDIEQSENREIHNDGLGVGSVVKAEDPNNDFNGAHFFTTTADGKLADEDRRISTDGHFLSGITLPPDSLMKKTSSSTSPYIPVQYSIFANTRIFLMSPDQTDGVKGTLATAVLEAQVGEGSIQFGDNSSYVTIQMASKKAGGNATCVFWDFSLNGGLGGWNSSGCWRVQTSNSTAVNVSQEVICHCNHLTHFAVLLSETPSSSKGLLAITIVTAIVTAICVLIIVLTMIAFPKLRRELRTKLLLQLCLSLFLSCIFLTVSDRVDPKNNTSSCTAIAVCLHYFPLAMIYWANVEAHYLYRLFVTVYDKTISHFFLKTNIFAWGVPAVIVFSTAAADEFSMKNYGDSTRCALAFSYAIYAFYLPLGASMVVNLIVFSVLCYQITKKRSGSGKETSKPREHLRQVLFAASIAFLLGLSWVFAFIVLAEQNTGLEYVFAVLQLLTSVCLLVFHILMRREIRDTWRRMVSHQLSMLTSISKISSRRSTANTLDKEFDSSKTAYSKPLKRGKLSQSDNLGLTAASANRSPTPTSEGGRVSPMELEASMISPVKPVSPKKTNASNNVAHNNKTDDQKGRDGVQVLPSKDGKFYPAVKILVHSTID